MTRPSPTGAAGIAPPPAATGPAPTAEVTARIALMLLAAFALGRAVLTVTPTMHAWGLNFARFAPPVPVWALWAAMVLTLSPTVVRVVSLPLTPAARALARHPALAYATAIAMALGLLLALPDRTGFVGDFLLRVGVLAEPGGFARMFPQAMPLDSTLHWWLPRELARLLHIDAGLPARLTGLVEGALVAALAVRFGFTLGFGPIARLTAAALVLFSAYLGLYTGYGKPTIEVALLTLAIGVRGSRVVREGRGLILFGLLVALAPLLHRAALAVLPGAAVAWWMWLRSYGSDGRWRRPAFLVSLAIPLVTLAWLLPRVIGLFTGFDAQVNFASPEVARQGGMLRAAFAPLRLLDLANLLLLYVPLAPIALVASLRHERPLLERREGVFLGALLAGYVPLVLFTQVTQGPFRDWDAYSGAGAAAALLAAWCVARMVDEAPRYAWIALPLTLASAVPSLDVMLSHQDLDRGLARAHALLDEPPRRSEAHRLATLDFIGMRSLRAWRWSEAADAFGRLAEGAPHPRALALWGTAAAIAHDDAAAQRAFHTLIERAPEHPVGWAGVWATSVWSADSASAAIAAVVMRRWRPDGPEWRQVRTHLAHYPLFAQRVGAAGPLPR